MKFIAIKMLHGDAAKYVGLIFGVTFATLMMSQQVSIFIGLMARTASAIYDVSESDVWVMDPRVRYIEEVEPLRDVELSNVRSVPGVAWAVPYFKGLTVIRMADGLTQQVQLIGIDDVSLVGICPTMIMGEAETLRRPQSAMMDKNGFLFTWPGQPLTLGKEIELNDHRLVVAAICKARPTYLTFPVMYVSYQTAMDITPSQRNKMSFVLVKAQPGITAAELATRIHDATGLQALPNDEFAWRSIRYLIERTGIPVNFSITIFLGFVIGAAITAQTFYIFIIENLKQYAAMKAIGVTNSQLLRMVLFQASIVALTGYGLGMGLTSLFFHATKNVPALAGYILHWQVVLGVFLAVSLISLFSIIFSLRKVFKLDPAIVFRG